MPYHDYACHECGEITELHTKGQEFPPYKIECKKCGSGNAVKIFTAPTIVQKGYKPGDARFNRGKGN